MSDEGELVENIMKWKSVATLFLGILLMIASMYINGFGLNEGAGNVGIFYAKIIIYFGLGYIVIASAIAEKIVNYIWGYLRKLLKLS
jgi:hypothetical protein